MPTTASLSILRRISKLFLFRNRCKSNAPQKKNVIFWMNFLHMYQYTRIVFFTHSGFRNKIWLPYLTKAEVGDAPLS